MLTNLFFEVIFCDGEWSQHHLQKSAYTLETHFKNVQFSVTSCKRPLVTEHRHKMQGFYEVFKRRFPFKNVQLMVTTCKRTLVTEHGLNLRGFKKVLKRCLKQGNTGFARFAKLLQGFPILDILKMSKNEKSFNRYAKN